MTTQKNVNYKDITKNQKIEKNINPAELYRLKHHKEYYIDSYKIDNKELQNIIRAKTPEYWKYSSVNRYHTAFTLAYRSLPDTTDTITVLYKIKDIQRTDKEVIYSLSYIEKKPKQSNTLYIDLLEKKHNVKLGLSDNIYINNICSSGSVISKDGEYRSVILNWNSFQTIVTKTKELNEIYNYILNHFIDVLRERKYILLTEYYFPTDKFKNKFQYETELLCSSSKIQLFCIVWFNFYYTYYFGLISNHLNEIFKNIMLKYKKEDLEFFKSIWQKFSYRCVENFRYVCSNYIKGYTTDLQIYNKTKLGQKIIPLNLLEAQNFFNITYSPWTEFLVNSKVSDLVINNITNGFSLSSSWFIIKNPDKYFYDNPSQADRIEKSQIALKIAELLAQAKLYTYHNINSINGNENDQLVDMVLYNITQGKNDITSWLSNEFKTLYNKIQDSINHTKEYIIMSNVSLCLITEFVGKTMYDSIFFTKQSAYYKSLVPNIFDTESHGQFRKFMFQICYNLCCLNSKLMIIHGDLHLNNITFNSLFYKKNVNIDVKDPKIMYIIDEKHQYIFDNNFYDLCLIDFSRAILHPDNMDAFKLDHIPYNIIHNKSQFLNKQVSSLLDYLYSSKSEYREFGVSLESSMKHHYAAYFKILTVLDLYNLTIKFIEFLKNSNNYVKNPHKESINLINSLNKSSEYYLTHVLNRLITQRNFDEINNMEWPLLTIIKDIFVDDLADNLDSKDFNDIVDIYNFNNKLDYSLSALKHFPPELKKNYDIATKDSAKLTNKDFSNKRRKAYETKSVQNYQVVNIIETRQLQKNL